MLKHLQKCLCFILHVTTSKIFLQMFYITCNHGLKLSLSQPYIQMQQITCLPLLLLTMVRDQLVGKNRPSSRVTSTSNTPYVIQILRATSETSLSSQSFVLVLITSAGLTVSLEAIIIYSNNFYTYEIYHKWRQFRHIKFFNFKKAFNFLKFWKYLFTYLTLRF